MIVRNKYAYYIRIIVSAAVVLCSFFPIFWLVNSSLKPFELLTNGEVLAPIGQLNLEGYKRALEDSTFWLYVKNSIIVGLISTFFVIILSLAGAYSLARMKFPGRSFISSTVLFVYMVPPVLLAIPIYMWMYKLGFLNTRTGVIFGHISRSLPFALWMMKGFFKGLPQDIEDAARRILVDKTNIHDIYLEQLYTYGEVNRDPRMRVVSTSYMALIDKNRLNDKISNNLSWFNIAVTEDEKTINVTLDNNNEEIKFKIAKTLKEKTTDRYKYKILENDKLAFDHPLIIVSGISRLKNKLEYTDIVFNMMPEYFTLGELQQVYEVILGKKLLDPAFRRIIAKKTVKTDKVQTGGGHRPSFLFRYNRNHD